jgi:CelD/BcsL family acetyltransferase involved in cellulose biosynthesis
VSDKAIVITLSRGDDAYKRSGDPTFIAEWARLQDACPWATTCQAHGFVEAWYTLHRDGYEPVIVEAREADSTLVGLLTLARRRSGGDLVAAGDFQAEYQTWISLPEIGGLFPRLALERLEREFPRGRLRLKYLPPGLPEAFIGSSARTRHVRVRSSQRGYIDLDDIGPIDDLLRKGRNRNRMNGLRRSGEVVLETLDSVDALAAEMDRIATLVDLRQGAMNDVLPFANNPLKRPFYLELMERGLLHVTILRVGSTMASVHLDHRNGGEIRLGVVAHEPSLARRSPGSLHILLLIKDLAERGLARYDMSPGAGPSYKDRFATRHDTTRSMVVQFGAVDRIRAGFTHRTIDLSRRVLAPMGHTPGSAVESLLGLPTRIRAVAARPSTAAGRPAPAVYRVDERSEGAPSEPALPPRLDVLEDLLRFRASSGSSRQAFLASSMERLERGHHVLTWTDGEELTGSWWLERLAGLTDVAPQATTTDGTTSASFLAYDFTVRAGSSAPSPADALARLAATVAGIAPGATTFVAVEMGDHALVEALGAMGAVYVGALDRPDAVEAARPDEVAAASVAEPVS